MISPDQSNCVLVSPDQGASGVPGTKGSVAAPSRTHTRRRFSWGQRPLAEIGFAVAGALAVAGWLMVAMLIFMLVADRNGPEGMTGFAVAVSMPPVLLTAFGFTALASFIWYRAWGARVSRAISVVTLLAAVLAPLACGWWWWSSHDLPWADGAFREPIRGRVRKQAKIIMIATRNSDEHASSNGTLAVFGTEPLPDDLQPAATAIRVISSLQSRVQR